MPIPRRRPPDRTVTAIVIAEVASSTGVVTSSMTSITGITMIITTTTTTTTIMDLSRAPIWNGGPKATLEIRLLILRSGLNIIYMRSLLGWLDTRLAQNTLNFLNIA